jgi:hypothetical protein
MAPPANFSNHLFYQGHYLPYTALPHILVEVTIYPAGVATFFWLISRQLFTTGFLAFSMTVPTYHRTAKQIFRFFYKILSYTFLNQPG